MQEYEYRKILTDLNRVLSKTGLIHLADRERQSSSIPLHEWGMCDKIVSVEAREDS